MTKDVSIRISRTAYDVLSRIAEESSVPLKRVAEAAIAAYASDNRTLADRVEELEKSVTRLATRDALQRKISTNSR